MPHAAQVARAFFAYVRGEKDGARRREFGILQSGGDGQQCCKPGGVVAGSRAEDSGAVFFRRTGRACWKDSVEVGGEEDRGARVQGPGFRRLESSESVANFIEVAICEAEFAKTGKKPVGPRGLGEGRRWDGDHLHLPLAKLKFVQMKPMERAMDAPVGGKRGNAAERGGHKPASGYSTDTRNKPLAGAVGPALLRSREARMRSMSAGSRAPRPISTRVPTIFRTMWCRKPLPVMM